MSAAPQVVALGWQTLAALNEVIGADGTLGRETSGELVLWRGYARRSSG